MCAGIAQLVERDLAKVEVAGSNPVSRSNPPPKYGSVTEWLCSGLQLRVQRFDSAPSLHHSPLIARVSPNWLFIDQRCCHSFVTLTNEEIKNEFVDGDWRFVSWLDAL